MTRDIEAWKAECESKDATIARLKAELEEARRPWKVTIATAPKPTPDDATYPNAVEQYETTHVDVGYSERVLLVSSDELDKRIEALQDQLAAANAVIEKLPHDRDGNPLIPGQHDYVTSPCGRLCLVDWEVEGGKYATPIPTDDSGSVDPIEVKWCRIQAAERAAGDGE